RAVRQRAGAEAGGDRRRIPSDLPLVAILARATRGGVGPLVAAVLAEFPRCGEAQRRVIVFVTDRGHLEMGVLAKAVEQLAERVGRLRRIARDGGRRLCVTLAQGVG